MTSATDRDSYVSIATRLWAGQFDSRQGQVIFSPIVHPPSYTIGNGAISPGVKRQGREANHSPLHNVEISNDGAMPPFPYTSSCCRA
jgi:hypothetical protein